MNEGLIKDAGKLENSDHDADPNIVDSHLLQLPFTKIKKIIKLSLDVNLVNRDSTFTIAKATELFIQLLAKRFYTEIGKSKLTKKQLDDFLQSDDLFEFLDEII